MSAATQARPSRRPSFPRVPVIEHAAGLLVLVGAPRHPTDRTDLKVEVKGTTGAGDTVFLTRNELRLAKQGGCALSVLHSIKIAKDNKATGGRLKVFNPWHVGKGRLEPMAYSYRVPKA